MTDIAAYLPLPPETSGLGPSVVMRAGATFRVELFGARAGAVDGAAQELQRHLHLATGLLGLLQTYVRAAEYDAASRLYKTFAIGETWRPPGSEYTVAELARALTAAYRATDPTGAFFVVVSSDTPYLLSTGPGTSAGAVTTAVGEVGGAAVDVATGAGRLATGLGAVGAAAGEGAAGVGTLLSASPLVSLVAVVAGVVGAVWLYRALK